MLSVFPELLNMTMPAIFLLRIAAGFFFWFLGIRLIRVAWRVRDHGATARTVGLLYGALKTGVGVMLLIGLYTQVAALLGVVLALLTILQKAKTPAHKSEKQVQILLLIICLSLLFLGPGIFAFDLPL